MPAFGDQLVIHEAEILNHLKGYDQIHSGLLIVEAYIQHAFDSADPINHIITVHM